MGFFTGMSRDEALAIFFPNIVYWVYSGIHEVLGWYWENKRLFTKEEEEKMNVVPKLETLRGVLLNQVYQTAILLALFKIQSKGEIGVTVPQPPLIVQAIQILVGLLVFDLFQYFGHRMLHMNKFLYKHVHYKHHLLVAPYAYGTQYQHPLENFYDNFCGTMGFLASGMTPRTSIFFFTLITIQFIDVHSALWLPRSPLQRIFPGYNAFHTVHHQLYGTKSNFSQPFFKFWDKILGTYMPYTVEEREGGGFELVANKKVD